MWPLKLANYCLDYIRKTQPDVIVLVMRMSITNNDNDEQGLIQSGKVEKQKKTFHLTHFAITKSKKETNYIM